MGSRLFFFSSIVRVVILGRRGPPIRTSNDVILILPPVQFGKADTACYPLGCRREYCRRKIQGLREKNAGNRPENNPISYRRLTQITADQKAVGVETWHCHVSLSDPDDF